MTDAVVIHIENQLEDNYTAMKSKISIYYDMLVFSINEHVVRHAFMSKCISLDICKQ